MGFLDRIIRTAAANAEAAQARRRSALDAVTDEQVDAAERERLRADGVRASATVVAQRPDGLAVVRVGHPELGVYEASVRAAAAPGQALAVLVDPQDPQVLAVDDA